MSKEGWELVFMMFVLKLPIVYLIGVVWWAIRATPEPLEPAVLLREQPSPVDGSRTSCSWCAQRRRPRRPSGRPAGTARTRARR